MAFEHQDAVGDDAGDDHARKEGHAEQERKPDGAAEKLGQIAGWRLASAVGLQAVYLRPRSRLAPLLTGVKNREFFKLEASLRIERRHSSNCIEDLGRNSLLNKTGKFLREQGIFTREQGNF